MKHHELPYPGKNNTRVRTEVAAAVSRAESAGGGFSELSACLQAAVSYLAEKVPPYTVSLNFIEAGEPVTYETIVKTLASSEVYTPEVYRRILSDGSTDDIAHNDGRLSRLQVRDNSGTGYATENDWFICDPVAGTVTAKANTSALSAPNMGDIFREYSAAEDGVTRVAYAFARLGFTPDEP